MSFNNTTTLRVGGAVLNTEIQSGPVNNRTVRVAADGSPVVLSIAHGDSNENGKVPSQRSNIRVALSKELGDTGTLILGYAQLTIMVPKGEMTETEIGIQIARLVNFLRFGDASVPEDEEPLNWDDFHALSRILAGIP